MRRRGRAQDRFDKRLRGGLIDFDTASAGLPRTSGSSAPDVEQSEDVAVQDGLERARRQAWWLSLPLRVARGTHTVLLRPRRLVHHRRSALARDRHADPAAVAPARIQSDRTGLAVPTCRLPLEPPLRNLPRHRRRHLRRTAKTIRHAKNHYVNRNAR